MIKKIFTTAISLFIAIIFCGCPSELKITPNADGTCTAQFNTVFGESLVSALQDITAVSQNIENKKIQISSDKDILSQIIDTNKIQEELNLRYLSQTKINIQNISQNSYSFIASAKTKSATVTPTNAEGSLLSQKKLPNGKTRLTLTLGAKPLQATLLQDETSLKTFADILMAPLITGEEMTAQEYRELLEEIYGENVTNELLSQEFKISVAAPNGKTLTQKIPVAELLAISGTRDFVFEYIN